MRLKQHHDPATARSEFCGGKRCANLGRMMSVIVDDENAVNLTFRLETPARASEAVKPFDDLVERNFQFEPDSDRGERVVNVVHPGHPQDHLAHHISSAPYVKTGSEIVVVTNAVRRDVSLGAQPVSHTTTFEQRNDCLHVRIVETQHGRAVEWNFVDEVCEDRKST